ncbi:lipid IV(A) 3-deoxy-D-manno-octulosonic acid transferase [Haliea sp. E17]|uniref:lipid IV(A) 3-deoxy-D-manno-octulosonic acid transferase n=1 Tax=Haliea sp. E17 TaxID=3401576 RepID=UPI003AADA449
MRYLYSALFYLLLPAVLLRMLWRSRRAPAYRRRLGERFGVFPGLQGNSQPVIWIHAASVGETQAARPLIEDLQERFPEARLVVTTTTPTGSALVRGLFGDAVFHVYCPWDLPGAVRRFLRRVQPRVLVLMETELWPNLLHHSRRQGCRVLLANARMSQRSARGYARFGRLTRQMLADLDLAACQSAEDAARLVDLGLDPGRAAVTGSLKFDFALDAQLQSLAAHLRAQLNRPVLLGASTHPGEEAVILEAFRSARTVVPDLLCLLVPRHPERFNEVDGLCRAAGFVVVRRSSGIAVQATDDILLGDTMGELRLFCGVASLCVVGGSFIPHGGQNPLEAAAWGVPLLCGPHMFNFSEITRLLLAGGGMQQLAGGAELAPCVRGLLQDSVRCQAMGSAALAVVAANRGARERIVAMVAGLLPGH